MAANMSFDRTEITVPADRPFQLLFENRDGAPHNVTVLAAAGDEPVFTGEVFTGVDSRVYEIPAILPGTYRFRCDVHPDMAGTVVADPSAATGAVRQVPRPLPWPSSRGHNPRLHRADGRLPVRRLSTSRRGLTRSGE